MESSWQLWENSLVLAVIFDTSAAIYHYHRSQLPVPLQIPASLSSPALHRRLSWSRSPTVVSLCPLHSFLSTCSRPRADTFDPSQSVLEANVAPQQAGAVLCTRTSCGKRSAPGEKRSSSLTVQLWIVIQRRPNPNKEPVMHGSHPKSTRGGDSGYQHRPSRYLESLAHQCVITILSLPLNISCFPPTPAIFASRDCANVNVTLGRFPLISMSASNIAVRKLGGFAMGSRQMGEDVAQVVRPGHQSGISSASSRDGFHIYIWTTCGNEHLALAL